MPRWLLPTLIIAATALFATGVAIERNSNDTHAETASSSVAESAGSAGEGETAHGEGEEAGAETDEHASEPAAHQAEEGGEDNLFGIDVESTPLVALAALASIALALAAWLRPGWIALLTLIAGAMIAFAVLDVREVFHQLDENRGGLAALAGLVAVVHLAAGGLGAVQRQRVRA
jgi:hypothetical protein